MKGWVQLDRQLFHGKIVSKNSPPPTTANDVVLFNGVHQKQSATFGMTTEHLDKHTLLIGSTGCGKTTQMNTIIDQLQRQMTQKDVMIIFDSKGDFFQRFGHRPHTRLIGNSTIYYQKSLKWKIFKEICADGFSDRSVVTNAQEISKNLFAEREKKTTNAFFPNAARDLLATLFVFFVRTGKMDSKFLREYLYNDRFKHVLDCSDIDKILEYLSFDDDARSVASYISGKDSQAGGVIAEMYSVVRDVFTGVFCEHGSFSIRDFVRNKGGKTLFVEYDLSIGQTLTPLYRLLFDLALKEALGRTVADGNVYLILDEFRLLPHLQHIDDAVNFGRSLGVKVFAGLQNVEQLFETYGENRGRSILAGFSNLFLFHNDDPSTLKYLSERSGSTVVLDEYVDLKQDIRNSKRTGHSIEDWDLNSLVPGEAIVSLAFSPPFKFKFKK